VAGKKRVGILGGMGTESTVYFFSQIVSRTPAGKDQDHLRIIIDNNPQIPDRTEAILGRGQSPLPQIKESLRNLEQCQVDLIAMPCNAIHYFYDEIQGMTDIPIIHLIRECVDYMRSNFPNVRKVGLIATTGALVGGMYQKYLSEIGVETIVPDEPTQKEIMDIIYGKWGIKAGYTQANKASLLEIAHRMVDSGARAVIAGCTEVELAIESDEEITFIKPLEILAEVIVDRAIGS